MRNIARIVPALGIICAMTVLSGCSGTHEKIEFVTEMPADIVLSVGDEECNSAQMRLLLGNNRNRYGNAYSLDMWGTENETAKAELSNYVRDITVSHWIKILSMNALAKEYEIELPESVMSTVERTAEEYYDALDVSDVEITGITKDDVTEIYRQLAVSDMVYEELTRDVSFEVSNDESRVMEVMVIYTESADTAALVDEELKGGSDFGALAANYNEYRSIEVDMYRGLFPEDVEEAAYSLENGEHTDRIKGDEGWYFIYCINKYNEELSNQNKDNIVRKRRTDAFNNIYDLFEDNVETEFNIALWDSVTSEDLTGIKTGSLFETFDKKFVSTR